MHQRVRAGMARSYQITNVFLGLSALDNVVLAVQGRPDAGSSFRFWRPVHTESARFDEARSYLEQVGLSNKTGVVAGQLSHGEQRALELAMALATKPQLLLLDEPLGALDKKLRQRTQFELVNIIESVGVTVVMVTHDQEEAMTMASRIAVMHHGRVLQVGTPKEIYECPINRFVADFIGNVNLFDGQLSVDEPDRSEIMTDHGVMHISHGIGGAIGMPLAVAVRPEKIYIAKNRPADVSVNLFSGKVREIAYFGSYTSFVVEAASGRTVVVTEPNGSRLENIDITWEDQVFFWWDEADPVVLTQ